jgi:hypothetical protein
MLARMGRSLAFLQRQARQRGQHDLAAAGVEAAVVQPQHRRQTQFGLLAMMLDHRQHDLDQHQDAAELADRVAGQTSGVTGAVQAFVVLRDRGRDGRAQ